MSQSLLKLQIAPVQDFIAQARSTRDLWSGSYLLSWLSGHLIQQFRSADPGLKIVLPCLDPDTPPDPFKPESALSPMFEWIRSRECHNRYYGKDATLPTVPNQLLAVVPDGFGGPQVRGIIQRVFDWDWTDASGERSVWRRICDHSRRYLETKQEEVRLAWSDISDKEFIPLLLDHRGRHLWDEQLEHFWRVTWFLWPGPGAEVEKETLDRLFAQTPVGRLWRQNRLADNPDEWMERCQVVSHLFDGRRQTRDFPAWRGVAGLDKDSLSGKEEALATDAWLDQIRGSRSRGSELKHLFRNNDPLAAPNLVKRVWHKAYLEASEGEAGPGLNKRSPCGCRSGSYFDIPSVPGVAAFPWAQKIWVKYDGQPFANPNCAFGQFWDALERVEPFLPLELPKRDQFRESPKEWLARVDWEVFGEAFWREQVRASGDAEPPDGEWAEAAQQGLSAVQRFICEEGLGSPSSYYAVLAGDGDNTGRWLSGIASDDTPFRFDQDFHRQMSAAVADFASSNTRRIVEDITKEGLAPGHYQGKLIYAGGEDVLAILPADQAIQCARTLRQAYQAAMQQQDKPPFTYSVGIAIGHIKEPLQDMVQAARDAEHLAKADPADGAFGRDALAVSLFKRSGETIQWGAKFDSAAFRLLATLRRQYRVPPGEPDAQMPITGRFPHRVIAALAKFGPAEPLSKPLRDVAQAELNWTVKRQTRKARRVNTEARLEKLRYILRKRCEAYLLELAGLSENDGAPAPAPLWKQPRALSEFYNLFAVEAFIARQGD